MLDFIVRLLSWVLSICTPSPRGRHRLGTPPPLRFIPTPPPHFTGRRYGDASHPAHPYTPHRAELRRQRERRRAAALAPLGIDIGPRRIHGIRVPAVTR